MQLARLLGEGPRSNEGERLIGGCALHRLQSRDVGAIDTAREAGDLIAGGDPHHAVGQGLQGEGISLSATREHI